MTRSVSKLPRKTMRRRNLIVLQNVVAVRASCTCSPLLQTSCCKFNSCLLIACDEPQQYGFYDQLLNFQELLKMEANPLIVPSQHISKLLMHFELLFQTIKFISPKVSRRLLVSFKSFLFFQILLQCAAFLENTSINKRILLHRSFCIVAVSAWLFPSRVSSSVQTVSASFKMFSVNSRNVFWE